MQMIVLPRQARDKHEETLERREAALFTQNSAAEG
eukprot:COSAG06_NODE_28862_length_566_cov_1.389722_1_plen_34_part_10